MGCKECGKPKCNGECGCKSPKVLQINNPAEYITFHKVSIPAAMGDSTTNPPKIGAYRNALVYYEADHTSWMYSTDGIPTLVTGEQGETGLQGPAGTITIGTTTTGESGTDAKVENVGTPENAILDFTIPRGPRVSEEEVQEDVNDKIDEMAEDGTLANILKNEAFEDLDVSDNYQIIHSVITDNTYHIIYHKTILRPKLGHTTYIPLKGCLSGGTVAETTEDNTIDMFEFSTRVNNVFMSNADSYGSLGGSKAIIREGVIEVEGGTSTGDVLTINNEGVINIFDGDITGTELVNDYNIVNSWGCSSIIRNGEKDIDPSSTVGDEKHPRTVICQNYDSKDIIFLHIEGRKETSGGLTFDELADFILATMPTIKYAGAMGGGGDSQLMLNGRMLTDSSSAQLRPLWDIFYLDPNIVSYEDPVSKEIADARMSETTMHDFLKSRVNLTETYLSAKRLLFAELTTGGDITNAFVCNVDYNTVLKENDTILVVFPDCSEDANASFGTSVKLNIHYSYSSGQNTIQHINTGRDVLLSEINGKTVLLKWMGNRYYVVETLPMINTVAGNTDLDDINYFSFFYSGSFTHAPTFAGSSAGAGIALTLPLPLLNYTMQVYFARPASRIYMRCKENGTWNAWNRFAGNKVDNFNGKSLDSDVINANYTGYGNNMTNKPAGTSNGWIMNIAGGSSGYNAQIYIERKTGENDGRMYIRQQENGTWSDWKQLAFVS